MSENGKISGVKGLGDSGFYQEMVKISKMDRDNGDIAWGILQEQFGRTDHKLNKLWSRSDNPMDNKPLVEYLSKKYFLKISGRTWPASASALARSLYSLSPFLKITSSP